MRPGPSGEQVRSKVNFSLIKKLHQKKTNKVKNKNKDIRKQQQPSSLMITIFGDVSVIRIVVTMNLQN